MIKKQSHFGSAFFFMVVLTPLPQTKPPALLLRAKCFSLSSSTQVQLVLACYGSTMVAENVWSITGFSQLVANY
jgi:hypothetical protein